MTGVDWFKFEDRDYDFPFYNNNPQITKRGWLVLFFAFLFGFFLATSEKFIISIIGCILLIVSVLYFLKWDYKAILRMPSRNDILLAVVLFIAYILYTLAMDPILAQFGIISSGTVDPTSFSVMTSFEFIFWVLGEEFIKFIPLMFFLRVLYKYTNNRKLSIIISVALVMLMFASMHAFNYVMLIYAVFIQGFGSIFEFYGYIKTKNIIVPFLSHLFTDEFILLMVLLGLS